ncbi:hypothetical protein RB595_010329 [Gaeumannomyces hyphopodioides]
MASEAAEVGPGSGLINIEPYAYRELADKRDIRLVTLLPGENDDPIKIYLHHTSLTQVSKPPDARTITIPLKESQATLPDNWYARETLEGRIIFMKWNDGGGWTTTWDHPTPGVDPFSYHRPAPEPEEQPATAPPSTYEALSYTWGPPGRNELISIAPGLGQPRDDDKVLAVGENLAVALRHLRQPDRPRVLWIDQICINQCDYTERAEQVTRMAEIYTSAWRVVVWLGPREKHEDDAGSDAAMDALSSLGRETQMTLDFWSLPTPDGEGSGRPLSASTPPMEERTWVAIRRLLERPWFERVWIVQEIRCSNKRAILQCGTRIANWLLLYRAFSALSDFKRPIPHHISKTKIQQVMRLTVERLDASNDVLSGVLGQTAGRKCFDERDKVYGLLALLSPAFRSAMSPPSYTAPVRDVFVDVTLAHVRHVRRLELLERCDLETRAAAGVPSWVPDFALGHPFSELPRFAAGYSECCYSVETGAGLLRVLGVRCGVLRRTVAPTIEPGPMSEMVAELASEVEAGREGDGRSRSEKGPCFRELFARTITANLVGDRFPARMYLSLDDWCSILDALTAARAGGAQEEGGRRLDDGFAAQALHTLKEELAAPMSPTMFLVTNEGLLGRGLRHSRQGDTVAVLLGCNIPMLLRPGPEPDQFQVVGPCYFPELEDATALLGPLPGGEAGPWRVQTPVREGGGVAAVFLHSWLGLRTDKDPRLPPLPAPWRAVEDVTGTGRLGRTLDDPHVFRRFRNAETGKVVNSDPRMSPEALRARGVPLEWFTLA